eukprot:2890858-Amphidinium_carterae.3
MGSTLGTTRRSNERFMLSVELHPNTNDALEFEGRCHNKVMLVLDHHEEPKAELKHVGGSCCRSPSEMLSVMFNTSTPTMAHPSMDTGHAAHDGCRQVCVCVCGGCIPLWRKGNFCFHRTKPHAPFDPPGV